MPCACAASRSTQPVSRRPASRRSAPIVPQADRSRHRRRQQRRAAARILRPLCARPAERLRRRVDAAPRADVDAIPPSSRRVAGEAAARLSVTIRDHCPRRSATSRYLDPAPVEAECADFRAALDAQPATRSSSRSSPRHRPASSPPSCSNEHYPSEEAYLDALGARLRIEYEAIVDHGFLLQLDCPDLAMERHIAYRHRPLADFLAFVDRVVDRDQRARCATCRATGCGCTCAGATTRGRTIATWRSGIFRSLRRPMSAASCCRSLIRATRTSTVA